MNIYKKTRLKRLLKILRILFSIFFWVGIFLAGILIILFVASFMVDDSYFIITESSAFNYLRFNSMYSYMYDASGYLGLNTRSIFLLTFSFTAVISIIISLMMLQMKNIIGSVEDNDPFCLKNSRRLTLLGILALLSSVLFGLFEFIISRKIIDLFALESFKISYMPDFGLFLLGIFFFILGIVFKYGNFLQEEMDGVV